MLKKIYISVFLLLLFFNMFDIITGGLQNDLKGLINLE